MEVDACGVSAQLEACPLPQEAEASELPACQPAAFTMFSQVVAPVPLGALSLECVTPPAEFRDTRGLIQDQAFPVIVVSFLPPYDNLGQLRQRQARLMWLSTRSWGRGPPWVGSRGVAASCRGPVSWGHRPPTVWCCFRPIGQKHGQVGRVSGPCCPQTSGTPCPAPERGRDTLEPFTPAGCSQASRGFVRTPRFSPDLDPVKSTS